MTMVIDLKTLIQLLFWGGGGTWERHCMGEQVSNPKPGPRFSSPLKRNPKISTQIKSWKIIKKPNLKQLHFWGSMSFFWGVKYRRPWPQVPTSRWKNGAAPHRYQLFGGNGSGCLINTGTVPSSASKKWHTSSIGGNKRPRLSLDI